MNISKASKDQIIQRCKSELHNIISHFQPVKKSGSSYKSECPVCGGKDKLSINSNKDLVSCFPCNIKASGAVGYLMKFRGNTYVDALQFLADHFNILITEDESYIHPDHSRPQKNSSEFRDEQLRTSGIPESAQVWIDPSGEQLNRYTSGTLDKFGVPVTGGDMLLHYVDLDGNPIMYMPKGSRKRTPYIRIRYAIPDHHRDKEGEPIRYRSPAGGGNHLWIPEGVRASFREKKQIPALVVIEGEKKADALTYRGVPAVGLAGIHNFAYSDEMPAEFQRLIVDCDVQRIIFFLDADFNDLGNKLEEHTDKRPRTFFRAVARYKEYFDAYRYSLGNNLTIHMAHGINRDYKGMDDLLVAKPELDIVKDINDAIHLHGHQGQEVRVINITAMSEYQLQELWYLHSTRAFMDFHKDKLKTLPRFVINKIPYRYDPEKDDFDFLNPIKPHEQYWEIVDKDGKEVFKFSHVNIRHFLRAQGFGIYILGKGKYRFIRDEKNIITEYDPKDIKRYVQDFTESLNKPQVLKLILDGDEAYLSASRLSNMYQRTPGFMKPQPDVQYFFFDKCFWKITADNITEHPYTELPGAIWDTDRIGWKDGTYTPFNPKLLPPMFTLEIKEEGDSPTGEKGRKATIIEHYDDSKGKSDIFEYFKATSDFLWRNTHKDQREERIDVMMNAMADKIITTGYVLCSYMDLSEMKAVMVTDAQDSPGGKHEGGTGKSIWSTMFEWMLPTFVIDASVENLHTDPHLYEGVDERTRLIVFDDCLRSMNFANFLSKLTRGFTSNPKGVSKFFVGLKRVIMNTNHTFRGDGKSFLRRQHNIAFGDYFRPEHTPKKEFGRNLFIEWDYDQWNWFFNFMACCEQQFLRNGLITFASQKDIARRKARDFVGEDMMNFMETYYYEGGDHINRQWELIKVNDELHKQYPATKRWCNPRAFKERLIKYCEYAGFEFNPSRRDHEDKRIRKSGIEFFEIGDDNYDINKAQMNFEPAPDFK